MELKERVMLEVFRDFEINGEQSKLTTFLSQFVKEMPSGWKRDLNREKEIRNRYSGGRQFAFRIRAWTYQHPRPAEKNGNTWRGRTRAPRRIKLCLAISAAVMAMPAKYMTRIEIRNPFAQFLRVKGDRSWIFIRLLATLPDPNT
jgi:hypothetical protein